MVVFEPVAGMKKLEARENSAEIYGRAEVDVVLTNAASIYATQVDGAVFPDKAAKPKEVEFDRVEFLGFVRVPEGGARVKPAVNPEPTEFRKGCRERPRREPVVEKDAGLVARQLGFVVTPRHAAMIPV
jgi:hypothetical protein